ncbi:MAG: DNA polymerase [Aeromonas veronii]
MSDFINLDFESRSEIDLKKYGLDRYSADRSTEIIMSAWSVNGGRVQYWDITESKLPPAELREALADPDVMKWAFNAQFERIMTLRRWGIETPYESWRCTMILAYMMGFSGDLAMIGKAMGLPQDKLKLDEGKKLIQMFCKPKKPTKNQPYRWLDALTNPEEWERFGIYNKQDVEAEMSIKAKLDSDKYPIPEREWHMYAIDQRINDRGVQIDTHFAKQALALAERRKPAIIAQMKRITGCANPGSTPQLLPWLQGNGYPFQDLRADTVKKVIREADHNGIEPIAVDVLRMRQNSNKSSLAKYQTMLDAAGEDGRFRFSLQFHGASRTGRWAGRRIQTQNLPRTPKALEDVTPLSWANEMIRAGDLQGLDLLNGEPMDTLVGCIRSAFVPGPGKKFVVCDLSSIESVVIGWLTNCKWFMETLAAGHDLYRAFAGEWLHLPYEETKPHRSKAKPATLGAGYRLGGGDLLDDGKKTGLWAYGENMGVFMTKEEAHSSVQAFRELCPEIVQTWYALENAVKRCLSTKQDVKVIRRCDDGPDYELPLTIEFRKPFLCIKLPSGRRLYYFDPKMEQRTMKGKDGEEYTKANFSYMSKPMQGNGWIRVYSHGGKLVENIVQAVARDVLAIGMSRVDKHGLTHEHLPWDVETVMHIHDELVNEVDEDADDDQALAFVHRCMTADISWAPGLPLGAAGFVHDCYRKD